jgi:hypothetical protein
MQIKVPLKAGQNTRVSLGCKSLLLASTGVASSVDVTIEFRGNQQPESMGDLVRGFKIRLLDPLELMETIVLVAPVDCVVTLLTSNQNIDFNFSDGLKVTATIDPSQLPLATANDKGAPGNPVYVSGITYSDAPATALVDNAPVSVTATGAAVLAALGTRKSIRFANLGPDPVAIGFTGITWAKRAIVLNAGDVWLEDRAANLAWAAITDTAKTASLTAQEVRA